MSRTIGFALLVWALSLMPGALILQAQTYGEITGTITDASGAVVAAVGVAVSNTANNQTRRVTTNESGNFTVPFLAPGLYDIRVEKEGFKTDTRKGVDLQVGAVARLNFTLELGAVSQVLELTGGAPLLAAENAAVGRRLRTNASRSVRAWERRANGPWPRAG